jgi:polysaccharide deacetylase 2 family uncharacterized protein YibQ
MAKRKGSRKKKPQRKSRRIDPKTQLLKILTGLAILAVLVVAAGLLAHHLLLQVPGPATARLVTAYPVPETAHHAKPQFEVFPKHEEIPPPAALAPHPAAAPPSAAKPRVAIIIDDVGYDRSMAAKFIELDGALTFAMLPKATFTRSIVEAAHARGFEIMLHLPMEPNEYPQVDPGPGALLSRMDPDRLLAQLNEDIEAIPYIKGVNNHMGSRLTASEAQMRQVFTILKKRKLYFIDSRTTADTICRPSAALLKIPFAERDVFLDHVPEPDVIRRQFDLLVKRAEQNGQAVGIGHPHIITFDVLRSLLPQLKKKVELVPASQIVAEID